MPMDDSRDFDSEFQRLQILIKSGIEVLLEEAKRREVVDAPYGRPIPPDPFEDEDGDDEIDFLAPIPDDEEEEGKGATKVFKYDYGFNPLLFLGKFLSKHSTKFIQELQTTQDETVNRLTHRAHHARRQLATQSELVQWLSEKQCGIDVGPFTSSPTPTSLVVWCRALRAGRVILHVSTSPDFKEGGPNNCTVRTMTAEAEVMEVSAEDLQDEEEDGVAGLSRAFSQTGLSNNSRPSSSSSSSSFIPVRSSNTRDDFQGGGGFAKAMTDGDDDHSPNAYGDEDDGDDMDFDPPANKRAAAPTLFELTDLLPGTCYYIRCCLESEPWGFAGTQAGRFASSRVWTLPDDSTSSSFSLRVLPYPRCGHVGVLAVPDNSHHDSPADQHDRDDNDDVGVSAPGTLSHRNDALQYMSTTTTTATATPRSSGGLRAGGSSGGRGGRQSSNNSLEGGGAQTQRGGGGGSSHPSALCVLGDPFSLPQDFQIRPSSSSSSSPDPSRLHSQSSTASLHSTKAAVIRPLVTTLVKRGQAAHPLLTHTHGGHPVATSSSTATPSSATSPWASYPHKRMSLRSANVLLAYNDVCPGVDAGLKASEILHRQYQKDLHRHEKKQQKKKAHSSSLPPVPPPSYLPPSLTTLTDAWPVMVKKESDTSSTSSGSSQVAPPQLTHRLFRTYRGGRFSDVMCMDLRGGFMSRDQCKWLSESLLRSSKAWKVVMCPVPVAMEHVIPSTSPLASSTLSASSSCSSDATASTTPSPPPTGAAAAEEAGGGDAAEGKGDEDDDKKDKDKYTLRGMLRALQREWKEKVETKLGKTNVIKATGGLAAPSGIIFITAGAPHCYVSTCDPCGYGWPLFTEICVGPGQGFVVPPSATTTTATGGGSMSSSSSSPSLLHRLSIAGTGHFDFADFGSGLPTTSTTTQLYRGEEGEASIGAFADMVIGEDGVIKIDLKDATSSVTQSLLLDVPPPLTKDS